MDWFKLINFASGCNSTSIVNFHSYIVFEIVFSNGCSSTNVVTINLILIYHIANIDRIPTEIGHILDKTILLYQNMRLLSLIPIRRINSNGTTKCANILFENIIFDNHNIFDARYVDQAKPFILLKKWFNIICGFPLSHL